MTATSVDGVSSIGSATGGAMATHPPMPLARVLRAYTNEAKYEFLRMLRAPAFAIPFLLLPVALYVFFGVVMVGDAAKFKDQLAKAGFTSYETIPLGDLDLTSPNLKKR